MFLRNSWLLVPVANLGRFLPIKYHLGDIQPCPDSPMFPPQKKTSPSSNKTKKHHWLLLAKSFCFTFSANLHRLRPSHASCSLQRASVHPSRVPCTNAWNDYHCHLRYDFVLVTSFGRHVGWWRDHPGDGRNDSDLLIQIRKKKGTREQTSKVSGERYQATWKSRVLRKVQEQNSSDRHMTFWFSMFSSYLFLT